MNNTADKLYNLLGTKFNNTDIKTLDSKGKETIDMEEIEMFSFDFIVESRNYGPVIILLSSAENLEVYYGDNTSKSLDPDAKKKWENLIEHLSTFARTNRLGFSLKHTSALKYDLSNITDITESYRNIFEGYYGTTKTSYSPQGKAKIIIKHSKAIGEEDKRFRNISSLFIENADGERFKLPFKKLAGARAMARHVTEGGNPYDLFGVHISEMVNDINTLGGFVRRSKMYEGNDDAMAMVETGRNHCKELRKGLNRIAGVRGYKTYKESWEPSAITEQELDTSKIRGLFTEKVNQRTEDALPLLAKLQQMAEEAPVEEDAPVTTVPSSYKGFKIESGKWKNKLTVRAVNRAGKPIAVGAGKTAEAAFDELQVKLDDMIASQKKVTGAATLDFNALFSQEMLKGGEGEIWAKLAPGPKLVIADGDTLDMGPEWLKSEGFIRSALRNPNSEEGSTPMLGVKLSAKQAKGVIANGRYSIGDMITDGDGNRIYALDYDSTVAATSEKFRMGVPAVTIGTLREDEIEWPEEVKGRHPDEDDWGDDDDENDPHPYNTPPEISFKDHPEYNEWERELGEDTGEPTEAETYNKIKDFSATSLRGYARRISMPEEYYNSSRMDEDDLIDEIMGYLYDDNWEINLLKQGMLRPEMSEMKEINEFEEWADSVVEDTITENTWSFPETAEDIEALKKFMATEQPLGIDAINVTDALYHLIGDDDLYDQLSDAARDNPEGDARPVIVSWVRNIIKQRKFSNPGAIKNLKRAMEPNRMQQENCSNELDADNDTQLHASANKELDNYIKKDVREAGEPLVAMDDQNDLGALLQRTNFLLKK